MEETSRTVYERDEGDVANETLKLARQGLPSAPARLWAPSASPALIALLTQSGYGVESSATPPTRPCDGALSSLDFLRHEPDAASRLRQALTPEGKAVLLGEAPEGLASIEASLAEAGFCLLRRASVIGSEQSILVVRMTPFSIRPFRAGDEAKILDLFAGLFHQQRSVEHWRWEYLRNPQGGPFVSLAHDPEGSLVAHYAGYPVRFRQQAEGGEQARAFTAFQIGDTMTVPEVRHVGRGPTSLLARTAGHFFARHSVGHVAFNYGFNVGNIQKFSIRFLRAERVEPVPFWSLEGKSLARQAGEVSRLRRLANLLLPGYRGEVCSELDERWDDLFEDVASAYALLAERRAVNLRWRYLERPGFDYQVHAAFQGKSLVAWGVFLRREDTLLWGDALVHPEHPRALATVLRSALCSPQGRGARAVEGWFAPRPSWLGKALEDLGFERKPQPQGLDLMCLPFSHPNAAEELRTLYYTLGDSDLF